MGELQKRVRTCSVMVLMGAAASVLLTGCGPSYHTFRRHGQEAMLGHNYGTARVFFIEAEERKPRRAENLHDLGACSVMLARERFDRKNQAAAMRELDSAVAYYSQALDVQPGHQASLEGKVVALKLKGQFDEALANAEWAARFVGPSARQYIFLAREHEERGNTQEALLRYRQAVAIEPANADAHVAFAKFLLKNNDETGAVHHLRAAFRLNPLDQWVLDELSTRGAVPTLQPQGAARP